MSFCKGVLHAAVASPDDGTATPGNVMNTNPGHGGSRLTKIFTKFAGASVPAFLPPSKWRAYGSKMRLGW
jgi:hypothetical protein